MRFTIIRYRAGDTLRCERQATARALATSKSEEGMARMPARFANLATLIAAAFLCAFPLGARPARLQNSQSNQQQPAQDKGYSSSSAKQHAAASPTDNPNVPADPHKYDRYNAENDIEVADFYMHKGDPDAAIPRLEEASRLQPQYGKPRLMLAECYEKKHDPDNELKYYKEYLQVYPHAPDAKKIEKKIEKLEK
jgi:tetratricopeptide (TPR) repeat protein